MIKGIVFDLDNTLVDFMRMKDAAVDAGIEGMIDAGLDLSREEAREKIFEIYAEEGIEYQKVFDEFLKQELGDIDHKILANGIISYRRAREANLVLYPHVNLTLMELTKRGFKLVVVSDAPKLQAWLRLCELKMHHIFDHVVAFEDTGHRKPHPAPFEKALSYLNMEPEEVLMVGDWAERDIVGAAEIGMPTAFARYGDTFGTEDSGADYELEDVSELLDILAEKGKPAPRSALQEA